MSVNIHRDLALYFSVITQNMYIVTKDIIDTPYDESINRMLIAYTIGAQKIYNEQ